MYNSALYVYVMYNNNNNIIITDLLPLRARGHLRIIIAVVIIIICRAIAYGSCLYFHRPPGSRRIGRPHFSPRTRRIAYLATAALSAVVVNGMPT